MKKIRKSINIVDFLKLWSQIEKKDWASVMPGFCDGVKDVWLNEINERFQERKRGGSYGPINDFILKTMLRNTDITFLPRGISYHPAYARKYPITYKKTGFLEQQIQNTSIFEETLESDKIGVKVKIPLKLSFRGETYGYTELEEKRSFIQSSFVLAWPKIIDVTLKSIGGK